MAALVPYTDMERMAASIAKSGLFGFKTAEQALAIMAVAQAEGLHPATAARDYHVINGRPALKADAMLARFQAAGGRIDYSVLTDEKVEATFSHPSGGSATIEWTLERAKRAELGGNQMWRKYPRQMLRARVISEGIRTVFPGATGGMYVPEEVADFGPAPASAPAAIVVSPHPESSADADSVNAHVTQFCADADEGNESAIVERWEVIKADHSLASDVWRRLKADYAPQFKVIKSILKPSNTEARGPKSEVV